MYSYDTFTHTYNISERTRLIIQFSIDRSLWLKPTQPTSSYSKSDQV